MGIPMVPSLILLTCIANVKQCGYKFCDFQFGEEVKYGIN